jgi:quinoprotein glucose dehydrogenase
MGYSPLADIDRDNVAELALAWSWDTGEEPLGGPRLPVPGASVRPGAFEVTPLVVGDTMYLTTPYNRVVALDAATGREHWVFDPRTVDWGQPPNGTGFVHRGVALWTGSEGRRRAPSIPAPPGPPARMDHLAADLPTTHAHVYTPLPRGPASSRDVPCPGHSG